MDRHGIIVRGMVGLIGASSAAALAISQDREAEYLKARQDFDRVYAESECLLAATERNVKAAWQYAH